MGKYNDPEYWKDLANKERPTERKGRPLKEEKRAKTVKIRFTEKELQILDNAASIFNKNRSDFIRDALDIYLTVIGGTLK